MLDLILKRRPIRDFLKKEEEIWEEKRIIKGK